MYTIACEMNNLIAIHFAKSISLVCLSSTKSILYSYLELFSFRNQKILRLIEQNPSLVKSTKQPIQPNIYITCSGHCVGYIVHRFFPPGSQLSFVPRSVSIYATRTSTTANLCRSTDVSFLFLFRSILRVFNEITYRERGRRAEYSDGMTSLHIAEEKKLIKRKKKKKKRNKSNETKR